MIAGSGIKVAKHGNRSMTSACGSADLLEALGVDHRVGARACGVGIEEAGIGFMFAPAYHPGFRHAGPSARDRDPNGLQILGPMMNPAKVKRQLIGVGDGSVSARLAPAQDRLGSERVLFVHSSEGFDEFGLGGPSSVTEYDRAKGVRTYDVDATDFGFDRAPAAAVMGGDSTRNVEMTRSVLAGRQGALSGYRAPQCWSRYLRGRGGGYDRRRNRNSGRGARFWRGGLGVERMVAASNRQPARGVVA